MKRAAIVLVRPRNPRNIGAAARVLSNFGFTDLRVVAPHPPVWAEARASATDGAALLSETKVFAAMEEALADRRFVWGTTCLKGRSPESGAISLPAARISAADAVVFGQEKRGLTAQDLALCDGLLSVPTDPACPSMNLAQSVAVVCYEIARKPGKGPAPAPRIPYGELERLAEQAERALRRIGYRPSLTPQSRREKLRSLLRRRGVAVREAGFLREVLRRLEDAS
ncbi:MAG: hypothetical protein AUJ52_03995 [Elusimicrobia bacterium CG1_02_63_36]|nr:MAG: hypothetical protein AUJ52_03995 [Elusimicrobia bacterium CG1_02_63_36]PIP83262.1 MAG: RNA methyltransferase [Elusimicrobia bacterium CG22_combo_CG10-13_8_21_14_all_63_91]PJA14918.1 MAG: RNA methyltransferase [Elusimicrobia bacterium CG_4_10_14_0_2_um_filter_63_34]PJB26000.1 MAG: RNA methyltransferase [Elusimicrobia bacterium CG_4_9_14_3_um_filter_62_55]